ncbi:unnamed protein product [Effrenium voratum]|uniref:Uncharacterized protein n=1 Tax=Effrenium voratum TaxID=2562239 RepID=A0AA36JD68_9DINO|nr:unnamed protein product [Effrenium voratum]
MTDDATLTQASLEALDSFGAMLLNSKISALHRRCILGIAWDTARCGDALLGTDDLAALSTEETALCEVGAICIAAAIELQLAKGSAIGSAKSAVVPNVRPWEWLQWRVEACARAAHIAGLDSNKSEALRNIAASLLEPYRLGFEELHQQELAALEVAQLRKELQAQEHQERQQKLKRIKEIQEQRSGGDPELQAALDLELKELAGQVASASSPLVGGKSLSGTSTAKDAKDGEETEAQDKHGKAEAGGKRESATLAAEDAKDGEETEAQDKREKAEAGGKRESATLTAEDAKDGEETEAQDKHGKAEADGKRASAASTSKDAKGAKDAKDGEEKELRDKHGQKEADGKRASAASTANDTKGAKEAKDSKDGEEKETEDKNGKKEAGGNSTSAASTTKDAKGAKEAKDSKDGEEKETEDKNGKKEAGGKSTSAASTTKDAQGAKEAKDSKDGEEKETEDKNGKKEAGGKSTSAASTTRDAKGAKEAKESKDGEEKETEDKNGKKEAKSGGKAGVDKDKLAKTEAEEKTLWVEPSGKSDSKDAVWLGPLSAREVLKMAEDQSLGPDGLVWGLHDRGEEKPSSKGALPLWQCLPELGNQLRRASEVQLRQRLEKRFQEMPRQEDATDVLG